MNIFSWCVTFLVSVCHISCNNTCREAGPKGCNECKDGWTQSEDLGCQGIELSFFIYKFVCTHLALHILEKYGVQYILIKCLFFKINQLIPHILIFKMIWVQVKSHILKITSFQNVKFTLSELKKMRTYITLIVNVVHDIYAALFESYMSDNF